MESKAKETEQELGPVIRQMWTETELHKHLSPNTEYVVWHRGTGPPGLHGKHLPEQPSVGQQTHYEHSFID